MWWDAFIWKKGKARVLQVKTGGKWVQNLKKTAASNDLYAASSVCLYSTSKLTLQIVSLFLASLCFVFFLSSSDTFLWMAVTPLMLLNTLYHKSKCVASGHYWWGNQVSSVPSFFLWTNLKTSRKRNSKDYHPGPIKYTCAFAKVKGCLIWNSATAVNLLRLPDIPSFTCWSRKGKWRLWSALVLLITQQEANTKLGKLLRVQAVVCLI